jgi:hypothetical protein
MATKENIKEKFKQDESNTKGKSEEQPLPFHNPLKPEDGKKFTKQDVENKEKFIEAQTERD